MDGSTKGNYGMRPEAFDSHRSHGYRASGERTNVTTTNTAQSKQPLTEVEALQRCEKILKQLTPEKRKRVLAFLGGE